MFTKPFYFHQQVVKSLHKHGCAGLSIKIQPETGFTEVIGVSITHCNPKDQFKKKEARAILETKEVEIIETRKLPYYIADKVNEMWIRVYGAGYPKYTWRDFAWMYKYVL